MDIQETLAEILKVQREILQELRAVREPKTKTRSVAVAENPPAEPSTEKKYFESFWQKYPNKKGKGQAFKAFRQALARADLRDLADGFKKFLAECEGKDRRYIPYAATWLNGDRWADDYEKQEVSNFGI